MATAIACVRAAPATPRPKPHIKIGPGGLKRPGTRQLSGERACQGAHPILRRKTHADWRDYSAAMWPGFPLPLTPLWSQSVRTPIPKQGNNHVLVTINHHLTPHYLRIEV